MFEIILKVIALVIMVVLLIFEISWALPLLIIIAKIVVIVILVVIIIVEVKQKKRPPLQPTPSHGDGIAPVPGPDAPHRP